MARVAIDHADTTARRRVGALVGNAALVHVVAVRTAALALAARLDDEGFAVSTVTLTTATVDEVRALDPDVVLVGYTPGAFDLGRLCRDLAGALQCRVVVVSLTSSGEAGEVDDDLVVAALDGGAHDFVSGEMSARVLAAHLRAAVRGAPQRPVTSTALLLGDVLIDPEEHVVMIDRTRVNVRPMQFQLLVALAEHAGATVERDTLLERVWGVEPGSVDPRRLRIAVSGLRRALGKGPRRPQIESVPRLGYRLTTPGAG
jgi:DNA-binding response OmpR family regulator